MSDFRKPFIETMHKFAASDPRIKMLIGDVGFNFLEPYIRKYPSNFLNCGAAESNMMGVAHGLTRVGWKPNVYTMRNFIAFRPYEFVRNDICASNANVKLFGVSGSAAYRFLGISHNVFQEEGKEDEDIALMKRFPNINVYRSKDEKEFLYNLEFEYTRQGPAYFIL